MKELIKHIALSLVDDPELVNVNEILGNQTMVFELLVLSSYTKLS